MNSLKILVVEIGQVVFNQIRRIYSDKPTRIFLAKSLGHAFEKFEEMTFDILIINGSALRHNIFHSIDLLETISDNCSLQPQQQDFHLLLQQPAHWF